MTDRIKQKIHTLIYAQKFSEILSGAVWSILASIVSVGLSFLSSMLIAQWYGAKVIGILAILNSFLMIVSIITVAGMDTAVMRIIPEHLIKYSSSSAAAIYHKILFIALVLSLLLGTISYHYADSIAEIFFSKPKLSYYFSLSSFFIVFCSLKKINLQAVRSVKMIKMYCLLQITPQTSNLILLIAMSMLWTDKDIPIYALLLGIALTAILGWVTIENQLTKQRKPADIIERTPFNHILSISFPMFTSSAMSFLISQSGIILLGMFSSEAEVGYYSIAVRLSLLTSFVLAAINTMTGPKISEEFQRGKIENVFAVAKNASKLIFWTTIPILLLLIFSGHYILHHFYGLEFVKAYPALVILIFGQGVHAISGPTGLFMNMAGSQNQYKNMMLIAATLNLVLCILLIPKYSYVGAAIASSFSLIFWNITTLIYMIKKYGNVTAYLPLVSRITYCRQTRE
ncbi:hypothetical protein KKHLCK_12040 [Candidatus Electrothrix laxa]